MSIIWFDSINVKIARWQIKLSKYNFEIYYVLEKNLVVVDDLFKLIKYSSYNAKSKNFILIALIAKTTDNFAIDNTFNDSFSFHLKSSITKNAKYEKLWSKWQKWMKNFWYQHILQYLKTKKIQNINDLIEFEMKMIKTKTKHFLLMKRASLTFDVFIRKQLIFRKRNESLTLCLHSKQIRKAFNFLYDVHNHFSINIIMHRVIKRFYWFIKRKIVFYYCRTCIICQKLKSLKFTQKLLSILFLQFFDCISINYIDLINSIFKSNCKYICLNVEYIIKFFFVKIIKNATTQITLNFFERKITNIFEWSRAIYRDNDTYSENIFTKKITKMSVKTIKTFIYHFFSIDLIEKMIQLIKIFIKLYYNMR